MRHILSFFLLAVLFISMPAMAGGWLGDVEKERDFLDHVIRENINGLHACVSLANGDGMHAHGEIDILLSLAQGESRPRAAFVHQDRTGNDGQLGECFVRRFEAAAIKLPTGMLNGPYIIRFAVVDVGTSLNFRDLGVYDPRPIGPYSIQ